MKRAVLAVIAVLLAGRLLLGPFREGWSTMRTDFPNHYVAAVLAVRHQPLRQFYDWEWFQRRIQYAGIDKQLGGYAPYPPLAMLPLIPLAAFPPQRAKQVWLVLELVFLGASVWLLSRLTRVGVLETLVLALLAYVSLAQNLLLGHYYLFLLFLLSCAVFCLLRGREFAGGALMGLIFSLKLYAAPFLLFFAVRRQWRALWGMAASIAALAVAAIAWFGWDAVWYFTTSVMTRGLDASIVDPYNPGLGSMAVLLRRLLAPEAELNPHPALNAPAAFFFLETFYSLGVLALALLVLPPSRKDDAPATAWFILVLFALSPVTAYSHFVLLLVPVVLLLDARSPRPFPAWPAGLIVLYALVQAPTRPWNAWLFPKLWFSIALCVYAGWRFRSKLRTQSVAMALVVAAAVSGLIAWSRWTSYRSEPPQTAERVAERPGALFSSAAAIGVGGVVYESMEEEFFGLRLGQRRFLFDGEALHPSVPRTGTPVYFELVSHGRSRIAALDVETGSFEISIGPGMEPTEPAVSPDGTKLALVSHGSLFVSGVLVARPDVSDPGYFPDGQRIAYAQGFPGGRSIRAVAAGGSARTLVEGGDNFEPAVSPDSKLLAYVHSERGARQVWIRDLETGVSRRITSGACNNDWPAWELDSRSVVFASDCSRGYGMAALYRMRLR